MTTSFTHRCLQWCNGFHYFSLAADWCPGSGFSDPERTERLRQGVSRGHTYESLITLGLTEDDLLQLVIPPQSLSEPDVIGLETVCGMDASLSIAQLIQERNEILLRAFSRGRLWRELNPIMNDVWYARKGGANWMLVDKRFFDRWRLPALLGVPNPSVRDVVLHLASHLSLSPATVEGLSRGVPCAEVELSQLRVSDFPPIVIGGDLHAAHERADAFVRKEFPQLPCGHLQFLYRFYV